MNTEHFERLKQGVKAWNKWWLEPPLKGVVTWNVDEKPPEQIEVDLSYADLTGMDLSGYILENAYLEGAILKNCNLLGARLGCAYCPNADFSGAVMRDTDICGTILTNAIFTKTDLRNNKSWIFIEDKDFRFEGALLEGSEFFYIHGEAIADGDEFNLKFIEPSKDGKDPSTEPKMELPATVKEIIPQTNLSFDLE